MLKFNQIDTTTLEGNLLKAAVLYFGAVNHTGVDVIMNNLNSITGGNPTQPAPIDQHRAWEIHFTGYKTFEADTREQAVAQAKQFENKVNQATGLFMYSEKFYQSLEGISHDVIGHCELSELPIFEDDEWESDGEVMWLKDAELTQHEILLPETEPVNDDLQAMVAKQLQLHNFSKGIEQIDSRSGNFQERVYPWLVVCFGEAVANDKTERCHRFLEESLELVQALGVTKHEAMMLVHYVFGRPLGEIPQEIGGTMVTLAALCLAAGENMHLEGDKELTRIWGKIEQIRIKQATKPASSPLPGSLPEVGCPFDEPLNN